MHEGHRERVRLRMMSEGLDGFEPHEIVEFLLFFAIPRRDVNPLAHRLIARFGSLAGTLEAKADDLMTVEGMTQNAAVLLSSIPQVSRALVREQIRTRPAMSNWREAGEYAVRLYMGRRYETFMLMCMDAQRRLIAAPVVSEGTLDESPVYLRRIVETALHNRAKQIVLVHNHPGGTARFSRADVLATSAIIAALSAIGINVIDHLLVADNTYVSMAHEHILENLDPILSGRTHEYDHAFDNGIKNAAESSGLSVAKPRANESYAFNEEDGDDYWALRIIEDMRRGKP